jgi:glyoxylase-like metal-dependent hydrolase (beta-lactamase superfamily II)
VLPVLAAGAAESGVVTRVHLFHTGTMRQARDFDARPARGSRITDQGWPFTTEAYVAVPIVAFLVEHPEVGSILIDTGLHSSVAADPRQNLGRRGAFFMSPCMSPGQGLRDQMAARDLDPDGVRFVVLTHLHLDHVGAAAEFPRATFVVDEGEWTAALAADRDPSYHRPQFDLGLDWQLVSVGRGAGGPAAGFGGAGDVLGDGSVLLVPTPGHSAGHCSVLIRLPGRDVLIAGDAAFTRSAIERGMMPMYLHDEIACRASLAELRGWVAVHPDAVVVPGHDAAEWERLEVVYE